MNAKTNDDTLYQMLRESSLAAGLSDENCHTLSKIIEICNLDDGEILMAEGTTSNRLYTITSGCLEVTRNVSAGEWVTLAVRKKGDFAGEMGFVDGTPHSATLRAIGNTQVFSLCRNEFEAMINTDPHLVYGLMKNIVRAVHKILTRMNQQHVEMNNYINKQHGRY
jgi:CRP-like cAMP-binding protein